MISAFNKICDSNKSCERQLLNKHLKIKKLQMDTKNYIYTKT